MYSEVPARAENTSLISYWSVLDSTAQDKVKKYLLECSFGCGEI